MVQRAIIDQLKSNKLSSRIIEYWIEQKNKYKTNIVANRLKKRECEFITVDELIENYSSNKKKCHIIGSGWSLNQSIETINTDKSFVIGFNNAAFADLHFDLYFTEHAGKECKEIMEMQLSLFEESILEDGTPLFFKNIWQDKNDIDYMSRYFNDKARFVKDYLVKCLNKQNLQSFCYRLMAGDKYYLKQSSSSILTMIELAYFMGFKELIIHGVDFKGPYFYETNDFLNTRTTIVPTKIYQPFVIKNDEKIHKTSYGDLSLPSILVELYKFLEQNDVKLSSAISVSPLHDLLN